MTRFDDLAHPLTHPAGANHAWRESEWLEADGFGGFASGTAGGERTRRYHALLLCATRPPAGRVVLVNGIEAWIESAAGRFPLTPQRYAPDVFRPEDAAQCLDFDTTPWPSWRLAVGDGQVLAAEFFVAKTSGLAVLRWRLDGSGAGMPGGCTLKVRPLVSGRDYHALHHENPDFDFRVRLSGDCVSWQPYRGLPTIAVRSNGVYAHEPDWYRNFCYVRERERGLDDTEDLAAPGIFSFDLARAPAVMILCAQPDGATAVPEPAEAAEAGGVADAVACAAQLAQAELRRRSDLGGRLRRSADAYLVSRNEGRTVLAGFPWFTDWGRDTFIAMRGLLLAAGRWQEAGDILLEWAQSISGGMLPNRFPDDGGAPEYNAVDAALWFVVAVHDYLLTGHATPVARARLQAAVDAILDGYARGTRFGIGADRDGLLRAGVAGVQLTWMDAKVDAWVVTPRIGKPVEVQALWINALRIALSWNPHWRSLETLASRTFVERFADPASGGLYDVVDVDHEAGRVDAKIRPNQIFAVGGLPFALLDGAAAAAVVAQVQAHLLTPLGLRTLAPADPDYIGRYGGTPAQRDAAYHQGTVWPWLMGPFVEAWLRVHRSGTATAAALAEEVRARFLAPLHGQLDQAGLDHVSEVADGDPPHAAGGAPFQAWSLGELLRIEHILAESCGVTPAADPPPAWTR